MATPIKHWNTETLPNPETVSGAQAKADAALQEAKDYTDQEVGSILSDANAYADSVASAAVTTANSYTDSEVTAALAAAADDATNKADNAMSGAMSYTDGEVDNLRDYVNNNFVPLNEALDKILLKVGSDVYELSVDQDGSLVTTLQND